MHPLAQLDHRYVWHPFTQMQDWLQQEPIVIVDGQGAQVRDIHGREYLDANSSIWTNLHGHRHPALDRALIRQLGRIAHSSALGLANEPAARLAAELVAVANPAHRPVEQPPEPAEPTAGKPPGHRSAPAGCPPTNQPAAPGLAKVFFSDDGSTAVEVALKLAYETARRSGRCPKPRFLSLAGAYHGDTVGAVSLGHIDLFHRAYAGLLFRSDRVMAPYCYRCPFNRAQPERRDARESRRCSWECVDEVERRFERPGKREAPYAAMIIEPLVQGAAGMIPQPAGWLRRVAEIVRGRGTPWIADEVMTGFGRTGQAGYDEPAGAAARLFACHAEGVQPDYLALAKGLTGGYLPMAATLTTERVFAAFLGDYVEFKTFFHGHSYTANQLGAATALRSLELLRTRTAIQQRRRLETNLARALRRLWDSPHVGDIRQIGLMAGIELVSDWRRRTAFPLSLQAGARVVAAMARQGVLTRPIGNVLVIMPPYCTTAAQVDRIVEVMARSIDEVLGR